MSIPVKDLRDNYISLVASDGDESRFFRLLNEAESRLQETAKWSWTKAEIELAAVGGCIYLDPARYASLLGVILDEGARVLRPREIEYAPHQGRVSVPGRPGPGHLVDCGVVTLTLEGEVVSRRKYKISDLVEDGTLLSCLVHLAHTTLERIDDYTLCPSARALKLAMLACTFEEAIDLERSKAFWQDAATSLSEDEATKRGSIRSTQPMQPFGDGISPIGLIM